MVTAIKLFCYNFFRGIVHCLKLSPNLRRQAPEVRTAMLSKHSEDKILRLKTRVLNNILEMVVKPKDSKQQTEDNDNQDSTN